MGFSKLLNNLSSLMSMGESKKKGIGKNINKELINELQQGMVLLSNRKIKMDKLKARMNLIENLSGFDKGNETLQNTSQNEINILKNLETNYNRQLSKYSIDYKSFMTNYYQGGAKVKEFKAGGVGGGGGCGEGWG